MPELAEKEGGPSNFRAVFIRAPAILEVGPEVEVLAEVPVLSEKLKNLDMAEDSQEVCISNRYVLSCWLKTLFFLSSGTMLSSVLFCFCN